MSHMMRAGGDRREAPVAFISSFIPHITKLGMNLTNLIKTPSLKER